VLIACSELDGSEHRAVFIPRDSIYPGISGTFLVLWVSKCSVSVSNEILFRVQNVPVFLNRKNTTFLIIRTSIMTFPG